MLESLLGHVPLSFHIFMLFATVTVAGAAGVAFAKNIVYSAFSLLAAFAGMVGLFGLLSADFLAVVQLMVYVGGILVLILFAVMLTNKIKDAKRSNPSNNRIIGMTITAAMTFILIAAVSGHDWATRDPGPFKSQIEDIGAGFLGPYLINFEIAGLVLLVALVAAVVVARKEVKDDEPQTPGSAQ